MDNIKLGIVISTYQRADGKTPLYIKRCLDSIFNQTYNNFKIFLMGDKYEDEKEILNILSAYDSEKIVFENLPYAKERDKYKGADLWSYGGVNAINIGIEKALNNGLDYLCHIDHDDYWDNDHLHEINECIIKNQSDWICTKSTYINSFLPNVMSQDKYIPLLPIPSGVIHSSVCMNFRTIPLRYRDIIEETGKMGQPADADLWIRCRDYINNNNLISTHINKLTCYHNEEGYERRKK